MKIEVELKGFYANEEENLDEALKRHIVRDVVRQIHESIREKVDNQVTSEAKKIVEETLQQEISTSIKAVVRTCKMKSKKNSNEDISMEDYVKECFLYTGGWHSFDKLIKDQSAAFAKELKARYDLHFATQLVVKMGENGLLKDDLAKLLIDPKAQEKAI